MGRDRGIPYVKFQGMVRALKRDFPHSFVKGPVENNLSLDDAVITWTDDGELMIAFPCKTPAHQNLFGNGKLHRHLSGGSAWFMVISDEMVEVRSQ